MREFDIADPIESAEEAYDWLIAFASAHGLEIASEGSLKSFPGCRHWHLRKPGRAGTLEATYWPKTRRFWFKVAANREAAWIEELRLQEWLR